MYARQYEPLARQIEQEIERTIGLSVAVGEEKDGLHLLGLVDTEANSEAAEDIARSMAPGREVINELEIQEVWPEAVSDLTAEDLRRFEGADTSLAGQDVESDFADHSVSSDPISAPGPSSSGDDVVGEGDVAYFPPTDPVIRVEDDGDVEVLGGFSPSSTDDVGVDRSASDRQPGDEALADAI